MSRCTPLHRRSHRPRLFRRRPGDAASPDGRSALQPCPSVIAGPVDPDRDDRRRGPGHFFPDGAHRTGLHATDLQVLSTMFLRMIKSLIVPLLFATLVVGIAGHGDDMQAGRQARGPVAALLRSRDHTRAGGRPAGGEPGEAGRGVNLAGVTADTGTGPRNAPRPTIARVAGARRAAERGRRGGPERGAPDHRLRHHLRGGALARWRATPRRSCCRSVRVWPQVMFKFVGHRDEVRPDRDRRRDRGDGGSERPRGAPAPGASWC